MRFFDTMDALLYFVNDRFKVVGEFSLDYDGQIGDLKASLVARTLWENVEVIDEFVRENPFRLPKDCLDTALGWKLALPGLYAVVRYQAGRAILMNDAGVFSVGGVTLDMEGEIGEAPAFVEAVLLPFDDGIVYDGFLQVYDADGVPEEAARIQDEFEDRCAGGIASTAEEFKRVARAFLDAERDKELEALLADAAMDATDAPEELPEGFHRGALAGLGPLEREAALAEELERRSSIGEAAVNAGLAERAGMGPYGDDGPRDPIDVLEDQAVTCAIACVIARGVEKMSDAYEHYRALVPNPLKWEDFDSVMRSEASYPDSYFGLWDYQGDTYLTYYTLTSDYVAKTMLLDGNLLGLRDELDYYEEFRRGLLDSRKEVGPKPLSRTLLENAPLVEILRDDNVVRLRRFLDERIPDGQDDYSFADAAAQEFVLTAIESGSIAEVYRLADDLGVAYCCADDTRLPLLLTNMFNAVPSWENNGWSAQELYEQLTGRRMFYNDDGSLKRVGADDPCPCGSGKRFRECCGR